MPEELTAKNKIEILSVLYGPYGCTALFVSGITSSIGKKECEAMQKAIASALDGDMGPLMYRGLDTDRLTASFAGNEEDEWVEDMVGHWAGPIPRPEEAE